MDVLLEIFDSQACMILPPRRHLETCGGIFDGHEKGMKLASNRGQGC